MLLHQVLYIMIFSLVLDVQCWKSSLKFLFIVYADELNADSIEP